MRVLVAGASGVIGRQLVPLLKSVGHEPVALARGADSAVRLERTGAHVVVADALDKKAVARAVDMAAPHAIVNLLTAIPADIRPRRMTKDFAMTNRLRTEGTRNLLSAAAAGTPIVAEGLAYAYEPTAGTGQAQEDAPLWVDPPRQFAGVLAALVEMERTTVAAGGVVLRLGHLYGPGSHYGADGSITAQIKAGKMPLVAGGTSTFSFTHSHDAATAVVAALDKGATGLFNIVDDEPTQMHVWLPEVARLVGGRPPKAAPSALARLAVGDWGIAYMTRLRGADNARARVALDWRPRYPSWRDGFAAEFRTGQAPA